MKRNNLFSQLGQQKKIADYNNAEFEFHTNGIIPQEVKEWLNKNEILFTEW